jgi:hypothetical protein
VLVSFPPTSVTFLASCAKPEAFTGSPAGTGIAPATIDQVLRQESDSAVAEALSDRIGVDAVVATMDEGFVGHVCARAARRLMSSRGYNRQAGADDELVKLAERADAYMQSCSAGAGGKRITPRYTLDVATAQQDAVRVTSHRTSDWWITHTGRSS